MAEINDQMAGLKVSVDDIVERIKALEEDKSRLEGENARLQEENTSLRSANGQLTNKLQTPKKANVKLSAMSPEELRKHKTEQKVNWLKMKKLREEMEKRAQADAAELNRLMILCDFDAADDPFDGSFSFDDGTEDSAAGDGEM